MLLERIKRRGAEWFPPTRARRLGAFRQVLVGETSQPASELPSPDHFSLFSGIGTHLELNRSSTRDGERAKKGRLKCRTK
jgi:hypothetical protein